MHFLEFGITSDASHFGHSEQTKSSQLFEDTMLEEQFECETVANQPKDGNNSRMNDNCVEQGDEPSQLPILTLSRLETPSNIQQSDPIPENPIESGDKTTCESATIQAPLSIGVESVKPVKSDKSERFHALLDMTGKPVGSAVVIVYKDTEQKIRPNYVFMIIHEDSYEMCRQSSATVIMNEDTKQMMETDSTIVVVTHDDTEQTNEPLLNGPLNTTERSFKDSIVSDKLREGRIGDVVEGIVPLQRAKRFSRKSKPSETD